MTGRHSPDDHNEKLATIVGLRAARTVSGEHLSTLVGRGRDASHLLDRLVAAVDDRPADIESALNACDVNLRLVLLMAAGRIVALNRAANRVAQ
jgi:hypothetical protein